MKKARYLFIHQNFPGQFVHLARALVELGHEVVALGIEAREPVPGVRCLRYRVKPPAQASEVQLARDFETKVARATACAAAMFQLKREGFSPDVIVAHPGWGEAMFCKDIWPATRLVVFSEYFYSADGADYCFDKEFSSDSSVRRSQLRVKNTALIHGLLSADIVYSPTHWQRLQIPTQFQKHVEVVHDGIDTVKVAPNSEAIFSIANLKRKFSASDEVLTFVNRNLEPYRGFHVFMRALPAILKERTDAHVVIVGGDDVSYGSRPAGGGNWREVMLAEVGAKLPIERIHFVGRLNYEDYLCLLQVSRCHVYLTYPFVLSWSCLEALSAGCVVVGSNTEPVSEVITHEHNGLLVDFFDIGGISQQVIDVLRDPSAAKYANMRTRARRSVVDQYDLKTQCLPKLLKVVGTAQDYF